MRSYRYHTAGADGLRIVTEAVPDPGPGEILVKLHAASINYRDLFISRSYPSDGERFDIPLSDGAGEVVALGPGACRFAVGDLVVGCFHPRWHYGPIPRDWPESAMGGGFVIEEKGVDGVLTEYKAFRVGSVLPVPRGLTTREAATLPCAAVSAWNALLGIRAGDVVLTQGTGGVSIFALQFAKAAGARVISTSSSDDKIARLRSLGADDTINYRDTPDWDSAVLDLTGGRGVDRVVEVGGGGTLPKSIASTMPGGEIALIGILTMGMIDPVTIMAAAVNVRPIIVGSRQMFEAMNRLIGRRSIAPVIDRVFPFEDAPSAYRYVESGSHFGKVVVDIG